MQFADITPKDAELIRLKLGVEIHNNKMELIALNTFLRLLEAGKAGNKVTKRFTDAYREEMAPYTEKTPWTECKTYATIGDADGGGQRKITISVQTCKKLDEENFRRDWIENQPVKTETNYLRFFIDAACTDIPDLCKQAREKIAIDEKNLQSEEKALQDLDTWISEHNAAAAQIRAILAQIKPIDYTVAQHGDLSRSRR